MPRRSIVPLAKVISIFLVFLGATFLASVTHAQVVYNGTQNTIISGITNGGQIPYGLAVDKSGNVFVSGQGQPISYVLEFQKSNGYQYNGESLNTDFGGTTYGSSAYSIAFDNSGLLYLPAPQNGYVAVWQPGNPILGATAYNTFPFGVGFGLDGNMYVADNINDDIYEISLNGGNGGNSGVLFTPPCTPLSVAADRAGNVYVLCSTQVLKYTYEGVGNYAESVLTGNVHSNGYFEVGLAVDRNGIVYICDSHSNRVLREVPKPGGGYAESQLPWGYNNPGGITLDNQGNLYIAESYNGNVDEITFPTAQFSPQALGSVSGSQSFSFNVASGTNIGKIVSLTNGQPSTDFPFTTTCALGEYASSTNCTITVSFSPTAPGVRNGAIVFYDQNGNRLYGHATSGVGLGPQVAFDSSLASTHLVQPAYTSSAGMALDNAGNLFVANQTVDLNNYPLYAGSILEYPYAQGSYGAPVTVASFNNPVALTVQPNGDLIVLCDNPNSNTSYQYIIYEVPKQQTGYGAPVQIASGNSQVVTSAVIDNQANVYYLAYDPNYNATILEIPFDGYMYLPAVTIASGFTSLGGLTMDASGNLYASSLKFGSGYQVSGSVLEFTASSNYQTSGTIASGLLYPEFLAMEPGGNLIVGNQTQGSGPNGSLQLLPAGQSGFGAPITLVNGLDLPKGLAVDRLGNLFTTTGYFTGTGPDVLATTMYRRTQAQVSFPGTPEGSQSASQVVTVENFGTQTLDFSEVTFPANFPEASGESTDCSSSRTLAPAATCTLSFTFAPNVALTSTQTGTIHGTGSILTNSLNQPGTVSSVMLSGLEIKPNPGLSLVSNSLSPFYGQTVTLTANVTGGVGMATAAPTGTVNFYLGSTLGPILLGSVSLSAAGQTGTASLTIPGGRLPLGTSSLTVHYSGDGVYGGGTSTPLLLNVYPNPTVATLTISPTAITPNKAVTLKATVSGTSTSILPYGQVAFYYVGAGAPQGMTLNTVSLNAGSASITQILPQGQGSVSANYLGNMNFVGSTSELFPINVTALTPTVTLTAPTGAVPVGSNLSFKVTVASPTSGYQPTGSVTFSANDSQFGSCTLASGSCNFAYSSLLAGPESITANYNGDSNFNGMMSAPAVVTIVPNTPKISVSVNPTSVPLGASLTVTASVATASGAFPPTGSLLFSVDGVGGSPIGLNAGSVTTSISASTAGAHIVRVIYSGDPNYLSGISNPVAFTVSRPTPQVLIADLTPSPSVTSPPTVVVGLAASGVMPTGIVRLFNGPVQIGQTNLVSGTAFFPLELAAGNYNLTASYSGDANYGPSATTSPFSLIVAPGQLNLTLNASPTAATVGQSVSFTAKLNGFRSSHPPTGNVVLDDNGRIFAVIPIVSGMAIQSVPLPLGVHSVTATYAGDLNYQGCNSKSLSVTVSEVITQLSVSATPYPDLFGNLLTIQATLTNPKISAVPTGTVTFYNQGNLIGAGTITGGIAMFTTSALPVGAAALSAQYSGDSIFAGSTAPTRTVTVGKAKSALTLSSAATSATQGSAVVLTATLPTVTIGSSTVAPTGSVTFYNGNVMLGSSLVSATGQATLSLTTLPVGTDIIHAAYNGDGNFTGAESGTVTVTISKGP